MHSFLKQSSTVDLAWNLIYGTMSKIGHCTQIVSPNSEIETKNVDFLIFFLQLFLQMRTNVRWVQICVPTALHVSIHLDLTPVIVPG